MICEEDMVLMISNSGKTEELFNVIKYCKELNIKIASITMNSDSVLAKNSDFLLKLPMQNELSEINAPTISALMALSIDDVLVTVLHNIRGFTKKDFSLFHPGGSIGKNLNDRKN